MNLSNLRTMSRLLVPELKTGRMENGQLDLIINMVIRSINGRLCLLKEDSKFNVIAEQYKYDLSNSSETVNRFFKVDKPGLYWNRGTTASPDWKKLDPKSLEWLDENVPQWRNADSGDPLYYAKEGKYLLVHPTPDTTLSNGFWLYFIENTRDMTSDGHYPFGYDTEIPEYKILDDAIIEGIRAWLQAPVGEKDAQNPIFANFIRLLNEKKKDLGKALDINYDKNAKIHLNPVC